LIVASKVTTEGAPRGAAAPSVDRRRREFPSTPVVGQQAPPAYFPGGYASRFSSGGSTNH